MKVRGIVWVGTRTQRFAETVAFFRDTLGLDVSFESPHQVNLDAPNRDRVEVFSPEDPDHDHFAAGPVVGFAVDDVEAAAAELAAAGIELLGPVHRGGQDAWQHFRGPDGNVYELTSRG